MSQDQFIQLDQFTKLYVYMERRFDALDITLETKADQSQTERIYRILDALAKRLDNHVTEQKITNNQYRNWIGQLAENSHTALQPTT